MVLFLLCDSNDDHNQDHHNIHHCVQLDRNHLVERDDSDCEHNGKKSFPIAVAIKNIYSY